MADIKDRAREYIAEHSKYSEVFGETFVAVDTLTAMVEFAEQETKELKEQIEKMKCCGNCENRYGQEKCADCHNYNKWKFKQAEQFYEEIAD